MHRSKPRCYSPPRPLRTLPADLEAERLGGLQVDHKLELGGQQDWQILRLVALKNARGVHANLADLSFISGSDGPRAA